MVRLILMGFLSLCSGIVSANSITIDFDDLGSGASAGFETDGFVFSSEGGFSLYILGVTQHSQTGVGMVEGDYTMELLSGELFSLDAWDVSGSDSDYAVEVTGHYASGGQISTTFTALADQFTTYNFSSSWQDLSSVTFSSLGGVAMDNVVVTTVPIPAAVWMFGSALAGLGWLRRKQTI